MLWTSDDPTADVGEGKLGLVTVARQGRNRDLAVWKERLERGSARVERALEQRLVVACEEIKGYVPGGRLLREHRDPGHRRVDPLLESIEVLRPILGVDHDLAIEHVMSPWEAQLGEVAAQRLAAAGLERQLVAVDESDTPEPVVLGLIRPLLAGGQLGAGASELRLDGRLER